MIGLLFEDERTRVELYDRPPCVSILPRPLHDPARAAELKELFPIADGWFHSTYAVGFNDRKLSAVRERGEAAAKKLAGAL